MDRSVCTGCGPEGEERGGGEGGFEAGGEEEEDEREYFGGEFDEC